MAGTEASNDANRLSMEDLNAGGRFKVKKYLKSGGMGDVYLAEDDLHRRVVLKTIRSDKNMDTEFQKRIERECQLHAKVGTHPHIVTLYDRTTIRDQQVLIMEYVDGETLQERLESYKNQGKIIPLHDALLIAAQCLDALSRIHAHKIVHRDIKPANLMLTVDEDSQICAKLMDFGIARRTEEETLATFATGDGSRGPGTPAYMAPEQIDSRKFGQVSEATDIYAVGVMLYEMISGATPFTGTLTDVMIGHLTRQVPPLQPAAGAFVPAEVTDVINIALSKNPKNRFPSAKAFRDELKQLLQGQVSLDSVTTPVQELNSFQLDVDNAMTLPTSGQAQAQTTPAPGRLVAQAPAAPAQPVAERTMLSGSTTNCAPPARRKGVLVPAIAAVVLLGFCAVSGVLIFDRLRQKPEPAPAAPATQPAPAPAASAEPPAKAPEALSGAAQIEASSKAEATLKNASTMEASLTQEARELAAKDVQDGHDSMDRGHKAYDSKDFVKAQEEYDAALAHFKTASEILAKRDEASVAKTSAEAAKAALPPNAAEAASKETADADEAFKNANDAWDKQDFGAAKEKYVSAEEQYEAVAGLANGYTDAKAAKTEAEYAHERVAGKTTDADILKSANANLDQGAEAWEAKNYDASKKFYSLAKNQYDDAVKAGEAQAAMAAKASEAAESVKKLQASAQSAKNAIPNEAKGLDEVKAGDAAFAKAEEAMARQDLQGAGQQYQTALSKYGAARKKIEAARAAQPPAPAPAPATAQAAAPAPSTQGGSASEAFSAATQNQPPPPPPPQPASPPPSQSSAAQTVTSSQPAPAPPPPSQPSRPSGGSSRSGGLRNRAVD